MVDEYCRTIWGEIIAIGSKEVGKNLRFGLFKSLSSWCDTCGDGSDEVSEQYECSITIEGHLCFVGLKVEELQYANEIIGALG